MEIPSPSSPESHDAYVALLQRTVVQATRLSHALPLPADVAFNRSLHKDFASELDTTSDHLLNTVNSLLSLASDAKRSSVHKLQVGKGKERLLDDEDDVSDRYTSAVEVVDWLLERTDDCVDILSGRKAAQDAVVASVAIDAPADHPARRRARGSIPPTGRLPQYLFNDASIKKPQQRFLPPCIVDNTRDKLWQPLIRNKPHSITENDLVDLNAIEEIDDVTGDRVRRLQHPYLAEIMHLKSHRPTSDAVYAMDDPPSVSESLDHAISFKDKPFTLVDNTEKVDQMLVKLQHLSNGQHVREIAIDLEHHEFRTYQGLACLLQISTREEDFVVDILVPEVRSHINVLNHVFASPQIIKILHGADGDILWLQRDLGLYIVNLFDTFHACSVLKFPKKSLAALLDRYIGFAADKRYQTVDWRTRPLPDEMVHYARSDTHFLITIYDELRHALATAATKAATDDESSETTPLETVLERSLNTSLRRWSTPDWEAEDGEGPYGWRGLVYKWGKAAEWGVDEGMVEEVSGPNGPEKIITKGQGPGRGVTFEVFRALHDWRDRVARSEDESPRYVLPNHMLFKMAERAPTTTQDVLACCTPASAIIRQHANTVAMLIENTTNAALARGAPENHELLPTLPLQLENTHSRVQPVDGLWDSRSVNAEASLTAAVSNLWSKPTSRDQTNSLPLLARTKKSMFDSDLPADIEVQAANRLKTALHNILSNLPSLQSMIMPTGQILGSGSEPITLEEAAEMDAEVPANHVFVPLHERKAQNASTTFRTQPTNSVQEPMEVESDDSTIIVSKTRDRPKKRKAQKPTETQVPIPQTHDTEHVASKKQKQKQKSNRPSKVDASQVTPFDYSSVPNPLDVAPQASSSSFKRDNHAGTGISKKDGNGGRQSKKNPKDAKDVNAGLGRAPRKMNEPKAGNMNVRFTS